MGVYMAWLTGWVANVSVPDEIGGALDQNAIFLFALVIALVRCAITDLLSQMDGLILMHLCGGSVFSVISIWGYRTCVYREDGPRAIRNFGGFGTHLRVFLCMAVSVVGIWYWYLGIMGSVPSVTDLDSTNNPECNDLHTFFFAKLDARGGIRIYYIFICIACTVYFGIMTAVSIIGPWTRICKIHWLAKYRFFRTTSRLKYATGFTYLQLKWIFYVLRMGNLFWIIFSIIMVEKTLNYNHIESVLGRNGRIFFPAQLLPMVIGLCSLLRILYIRFEKWRSPEDIKPSLGDRPTTPTRAATVPRGKGWLRAFAPRTEIEGTSSKVKDTLEDGDMDVDMIHQPAWWRYLVAWLPWLHAASSWFKQERREHVENIGTATKKEDLEPGRSERTGSSQRGELRETQNRNSDSSFDDRRKSEGSFV